MPNPAGAIAWFTDGGEIGVGGRKSVGVSSFRLGVSGCVLGILLALAFDVVGANRFDAGGISVFGGILTGGGGFRASCGCTVFGGGGMYLGPQLLSLSIITEW